MFYPVNKNLTLYVCIPMFLHQHVCTWAAGISRVSRTDPPHDFYM